MWSVLVYRGKIQVGHVEFLNVLDALSYCDDAELQGYSVYLEQICGKNEEKCES